MEALADEQSTEDVVAEPAAPVTTETLAGWLSDLGRLRPVDDKDRVDQLTMLETLKNAIASAQAVTTVEFVASKREERKANGVRARRLDDGLASEVARARRESSYHGARHVALSFALLELPFTAAAFARGEITEWCATIVARETACLSREDRQEVDRRLGTREGGIAAMGDQELAAEARRIAYALDPVAFTERANKAKKDRRVSLRPAPDTMTYLSGLLPVREGVAVYAALTKHADALRAQGDDRSRSQIMADTLVERVTGLSVASDIPVEVNVVMSDLAVFGEPGAPGSDTPAYVDGYGPVPAPLAREWLRNPEAKVWIRRLYARASDHALVGMDSARRRFAGNLRRFIGLRDQRCRTPWCDAPIRHTDHVQRHADGGPTSVDNSQGLCEACNHAKEASGWSTRLREDGSVETTTSTGHRYRSPVPRPPAYPDTPQLPSRIELSFRNRVLIA